LFIGFPSNQKGYLLFFPHSRSLAISGDVTFDETFYSSVVTTWRRFNNSLLIKPSQSFLPNPDTVLEETGTIDDLLLTSAEEGSLTISESPLIIDMEDKWSPTASFRALKMFLAHAAHLQVRVKQLHFIGAFLRAKVRSRVFIKFPTIYSKILPEYKQYFGVPLRLLKSMYGMTLSGKFWYIELMEALTNMNFIQSTTIHCLFYKIFPDGSSIYILNYVDNMLYFGTSAPLLDLASHFALEKLGQAHWYLATRIIQQVNYDITLDQSKYCKSIIKRYLESAGCKNVTQTHTTPLPSGFVPSLEDLSPTDDDAHTLSIEYKIDFRSCIGSLIYLTLTRTDILYAVNKLAKFDHRPGKTHFDALVHVLRYLRDNIFWGLRFYSDISTSPVHHVLLSNNLPSTDPFITMCDSSWNDDVDHGRSTGCFLIFYMGGIIDHSSNLPDPIALSSAEAEYNQACLALVASTHVSMILEDLTQQPSPPDLPIFMDSQSGIAIGSSFKDTKHIRHILRRYHYVRDTFNTNRFRTYWIPTEFELANIGTKNLPGPRHSFLRSLCLVPIQDSSVQEG
jgi:hypothetical protein